MQKSGDKGFLKYGDKLVLKCQDDAKSYFLMARSPHDQQLYIVQSEVKQLKDESNSFSLYNWQAQMIFQVYPKLQHEASKRYQKLSDNNELENQKDQSKKIIQEIQRSLLKKRMEQEKISNMELVKSYKGQPVKYGDQIILYHPLTSNFVLATNKTLTKSTEYSRQYLFSISRQMNSSMYFTIQPDPLALDAKAQSSVSLYDQFVLVTYKMLTMPKFSNLLEVQRIPQIRKSLNYDHDDSFLPIPLLMENQFMFKYFKAYHKIADTDTKEERSQNALSAIVLPPDQKDKNFLCYGQYIRVKYYKLNTSVKKNLQKRQTSTSDNMEDNENDKQNVSKGYISSCMNAIGINPQVVLQIQGLQDKDYMEKASSVFQVIPESDEFFGKPVMLNIGQQSQTIGYVHMTLRHLLTGKFLKMSTRNKLILSHDVADNLLQDQSVILNSPQLKSSQTFEPQKSIQQKNMPGMKLYKEYRKSSANSLMDDIIMSGSDPIITIGNQTQQLNKSSKQMQSDTEPLKKQLPKESLLFVMKLGNGQSFNYEQVEFPINNFFNMASHNSESVLEVEIGEGKEIAYQERLTYKFEKFTNFSEDPNPKQKHQKIIRDEFCYILPNLELTSKRPKSNITNQEKEIINFIEEEEKTLSDKKIDVGHFKQINYTFMHTFANLNPLKINYYDISGGEDQSGSNFWFEQVSEQEIKEYNELLSFLQPLIVLAKHPIHFAIIKYYGGQPFQQKKVINSINKNPIQQTSEKKLGEQVQEAQNQAIVNIQEVVKSLDGLQIWLCGKQEQSQVKSIIQEPLSSRQTMFREIGVIDLVIKILYEMYINGWLQNKYQTKDNIVGTGKFTNLLKKISADQDDNNIQQEINMLSEQISNFLQLVIKNSYENSLYVVQWYLLFKQILLEGSLLDSMRLDIILMQLFQQTEINITFQFEVESLARDASFEQYNKHAYNLLIAFCLHSSYRTRESLNELLNHIFTLNKDTIFAQFNYDQDQKAIQLRKSGESSQWMNISQPYNEIVLLPSQIMSPRTNRSPFSIFGTQFNSRQQANEYMISCVRLITELSKSNPSMVVKHIHTMLPFITCVRIISDLHISPVIRTQILDFLKSSFMQHDLQELRTISFPQLIKFKNKSSESMILSHFNHDHQQNTDSITYHHYFSQKKISDIYQQMQDKYLQKVGIGGSIQVEGEDSVNMWVLTKMYMNQMLDGKSIHDIKPFEHQYLQQLLRSFILIFSKGLFIMIFQSEKSQFTDMYSEFIKFLRSSVLSANNKDQLIDDQTHRLGFNGSRNYIEISDKDDDAQMESNPFRENQRTTQSSKSHIARGAVWLDELIDIINLLEQYQQNLLVDDFVQDKKTDKIFDEFAFLEAHESKNKEKMVNKLKQIRNRSSHYILRNNSRVNNNSNDDIGCNNELISLIKDLSVKKKNMIIDYSSKLSYNHGNLFEYLTELLTFNQVRLSSAIIELLWTIFTTKSTFLSTVNNLCVLDASEHIYILRKNLDNGQKQGISEDHQQVTIYTEFTAIFWRIHFALTALQGENNDPKNYDTINDALSDMLIIFYTDYAAKTDIQNFMELNQMENEERHHGAYEQPIVKSKAKQEMMVELVDQQYSGFKNQKQKPADQYYQQININSAERHNSNNDEEKFNYDPQMRQPQIQNQPDQPLKRVSKYIENIFEIETEKTDKKSTQWRVSQALSVDVLTICYRQKMLRYLGFHDLLKRLFCSLIQETNGNIFRERNQQQDQKKNKQWEVMNEVLEKSIMFLLFFVLRNEENQELILKDHLKHQNSQHRDLSYDNNNYLFLLAGVENKQFQLLVYKLMAELFKDNYSILFKLERYSDDNGVVGRLFKKFEHNLSKNNLESCIYFLQFIPNLIKIKSNDIIQNNEILTQMFKNSKHGISSKVQILLKKAFETKVEQNLRGFDASPHSSLNDGIQQDSLGIINIPLEICFLTEFFNLMRQIGIKSSPSIDDFTKNLLPISLLQEALTQLDEWYPLKLSILKYFQQVYLDNANKADQDEKNEIESFVMDCVFKQLTALTENQNLVKYRYNRVQLHNPVLFNIHQVRTFFSTLEFLYKLDYEHTAYLYIIFGVVEVIGNFIKKVMPECWRQLVRSDMEIIEIFDNQSKTDLLYVSSSIFDVLQSVRSFLYQHPEQSQNHVGRIKSPFKVQSNYQEQETVFKRRQTKKPTRKIMSSMNQNHDDPLGQGLISEDDEVHLMQEEDQQSIQFLTKSLSICQELQTSTISHQANKKVQLSFIDKSINQKWEAVVLNSKKKIIDENLIHTETEREMQNLVKLIVAVKTQDTDQFQKIISSIIQTLSVDFVSPSTKQKSITILRKLSNYKDDALITQSILKDLGELGFTDFLCDLICTEQNGEQKIEYIKGFVEYLDDSSFQVQVSFYNYLIKDTQNRFLISLRQYVLDIFEDIKLSEKGRQDTINKQQKSKLKRIITEKMNSCIFVIELLRLGCENHYTDMQNFFRDGQPSSSSITEVRYGTVNIIVFVADLFEKYSKIMNELNAKLGEKMIEFLIEIVQGPCIQNQEELCEQTRILEVLEEVNLSLRLNLINSNNFTSKDVLFSSLRYKIFLLQLSMMEGNTNEEIHKKISQFFNPQLLLERIDAVYYKAVKKMSKIDPNATKNAHTINAVDNQYGLVNTKDTLGTLNTDNGIYELLEDEMMNELVQQNTELTQTSERIIDSQGSISLVQCEQMVKECLLIFILLKKLKKYIPQIQQYTCLSGKSFQKAIAYFRNRTTSIEIINMHGNLEKIYFPIPTLMQYLSEESRMNFMETVNRESINDKINGLLDQVDNFYYEMQYYSSFKNFGLRHNNTIIQYLRNSSILIAFTINILLLCNLDELNYLIKVLTVINIIFYGIIFFVWCIFRMKMEYYKISGRVTKYISFLYPKKKSAKRTVSHYEANFFWFMMIFTEMTIKSYTFYWMIFLVFSFLAIFYSPLYYGFLLFDIIDHSENLKNVIKSITQNYKQLVMTAVLGILIFYLYSIVSFQSTQFRSTLQDVSSPTMIVCYTPFQCFIYIMHQGLRNNGGIGDSLVQIDPNIDIDTFSQRVVYDLSFFVIVTVLVLNIIYGIIIDSFAELRDQTNQKDYDSHNKCFICNLSRSLFEKEGISFQKHTTKQHHIWSYLTYLIYLKVKEQTEYTGIESYVSAKVDKKDISWFPIEQAIKLQIVENNLITDDQD